jgi:uncharacterized protein (TIGR00730 family)
MNDTPATARDIRSVCLFCGASVGTRPAYVAAARSLAETLAREGVGLVYGGGSVGLMNEAANAALLAGGRIVGVITRQLMAREIGHAGLTELHVVETMHERKALMARRSDAFVALPGGFGTFDEMCEMLTWNQLGIHAKPVVMLNVEGYFDGFLAQLQRARADGLLRAEHREVLLVADRVEDVLPCARRWQPPPVPQWLRAAAPPA